MADRRRKKPRRNPVRKAKPWVPPAPAVTLAAELLVQGVAIDRLVIAVSQEKSLDLKGCRGDALLEQAMSTIAKRSEHLRRHAGDLEAARLEQLFKAALAVKDFKAAMEAHRGLALLSLASPAAEAELPAPAPYSFDARYRRQMAGENGA